LGRGESFLERRPHIFCDRALLFWDGAQYYWDEGDMCLGLNSDFGRPSFLGRRSVYVTMFYINQDFGSGRERLAFETDRTFGGSDWKGVWDGPHLFWDER